MNKVFIAGTGKSGIAAAKMLLKMGGETVLYNSDPNTDSEKVLENFEKTDKVSVLTGKLHAEDLEDISMCVISPGIPLKEDFVKVIDKKGLPILGELEMAYQLSKGVIAAITGTNGKTTTTALCGEILKNCYKDVHVAGNIGTPFSEEALKTGEESRTVLEVSSFMLETIMDFHPHVSAILNITPDHLDRHKTMKNYIRCKEAVAFNQTEEDDIVLNYSDPELRKFGKSSKLKAHVIWFSSEEEPAGDAVYLKDDRIMVKYNGTEEEFLPVSELNLIGKHNYENVCAAVAVTLRMDVPMDKIREACRNFKAVEHRIEFVRTCNGVKYYNDSKGTNPDAAIKALKAMPGQTLLIGGGYDKHIPFDDWVKLFPGKVRIAVLMGETRNQIAETCRKFGFKDIVYADNMEEAVRTCASYAHDGDYVLLSPACASWGMYRNFEERGRDFKKFVNDL